MPGLLIKTIQTEYRSLKTDDKKGESIGQLVDAAIEEQLAKWLDATHSEPPRALHSIEVYFEEQETSEMAHEYKRNTKVR